MLPLASSCSKRLVHRPLRPDNDRRGLLSGCTSLPRIYSSTNGAILKSTWPPRSGLHGRLFWTPNCARNRTTTRRLRTFPHSRLKYIPCTSRFGLGKRSLAGRWGSSIFELFVPRSFCWQRSQCLLTLLSPWMRSMIERERIS